MNIKLLVSILVGATMMAAVASANTYFLFQQFTSRDCQGDDVYASYNVAGQCHDSRYYSCFENGTAILEIFDNVECQGTPSAVRSFDLTECQYGFSIKCTPLVVVPNNTLASYGFSGANCGGEPHTVKYQRTNTCFSGNSISCNSTSQTYNYYDNLDCSGTPSTSYTVDTEEFCPDNSGVSQTRDICQQ